MTELSKTVRYHINLGNYEWVELSATVTAPKESGVDTGEYIDTIIKETLAKDLQEAVDTTSENKSFIQYLNDDRFPVPNTSSSTGKVRK